MSYLKGNTEKYLLLIFWTIGFGIGASYSAYVGAVEGVIIGISAIVLFNWIILTQKVNENQ